MPSPLILRLFLIYFSLSFLITTITALYYVPFAKQQIANSYCQQIASVNVTGDVITVFYPTRLPSTDPLSLSRLFTLDTIWLDEPISFPPGSASLLNATPSSLSLRFYLPVVSSYAATLRCPVDSAHRAFDLAITASDFSRSPDYSRLRCHHAGRFATRWCEFANLAYVHGCLCFFSPARFRFPAPFIAPGARAPPFDRAADRLAGEPLVLQMRLADVPAPLEETDDFCYLYGVFFNYHMLWHAVFDFLVPMYHFMKTLGRPEGPARRRVFVPADGVWAFELMMRVLAERPVTVVGDMGQNLMMRAGTIGIEKPEKDPRSDRLWSESIRFEYNFNRSTARGMREELLAIVKMPADAVGLQGKPLALLIDRGDTRNIRNKDEIYALMRGECPHCHVVVVELHKMEVEEQLRMVSRASVLVGRHGSGLAHVIWMHESTRNHSTHLIEILPYNYSCRNWYHTAADVAGVEYHAVMNDRPPNSSHLKGCWGNPGLCHTSGCHDALRDQETVVEHEAFLKVWLEVAESLKYTIVR